MTGDPLKIGVLLPRSSLHPALGENLIAGMRLYFGPEAGQAVQFVTEDIGFGQSAIEQKAHKLVGADRVDLVVGVVNVNLATMVHHVFHAGQTFFIGVNVGENVPRQDEHSPFVFYNSLSHWQANYVTGAWAARNLGRRAFLALSFYDSGYDAPYAFRVGVESAGGEVVRTYLSHRPPDTGDFAPLFDHIRETRPDFVYACYCGSQAVDFARAYADSDLAGRIPLAGSAFLVDEKILPEQGQAALGIKSGLSWADDLRTPEYQTFASAYQGQTGRAPDPFAVLGYETSQLIATALQAAGGNMRRADRVREALASARFASPRGQVTMDPQTHSVQAPLYLREVRQRGDSLGNVTVGTLDSISELDPRFTELRSGPRSGWVNAYLCR